MLLLILWTVCVTYDWWKLLSFVSCESYVTSPNGVPAWETNIRQMVINHSYIIIPLDNKIH